MAGEIDFGSPEVEQHNQSGQLARRFCGRLKVKRFEAGLQNGKDGDLGFFSSVAVSHFSLRSTGNVSSRRLFGERNTQAFPVEHSTLRSFVAYAITLIQNQADSETASSYSGAPSGTTRTWR